jgi:hypothetical protein
MPKRAKATTIKSDQEARSVSEENVEAEVAAAEIAKEVTIEMVIKIMKVASSNIDPSNINNLKVRVLAIMII